MFKNGCFLGGILSAFCVSIAVAGTMEDGNDAISVRASKLEPGFSVAGAAQCYYNQPVVHRAILF